MRCKGVGPLSAEIMIIGEAPGEMEERKGVPFVGPSGAELDRFLESVRLNRERMYVTNLVKERPPHNSDPTWWMIERDEPELLRELDMVSPKVVLTLGRFATRWFLGDVDMEHVHGIPHPATKGDWAGVVLPCYHPAAGLHSADLQSLIAYDIAQLRALMAGEIKPHPVQDTLTPIYTLLDGTNPSRELQWKRHQQAFWVAMDTEGRAGAPWGLSYSVLPGSAAVVKADNAVSLENVRKTMEGPYAKVILHNSLYDLGVLRDMGIDLRPGQYVDTMIMAYLLCVEPQGLKALAYRHAGAKQPAYMETVGPAQQLLARKYLEQVVAHQCRNCRGIGQTLQITKKVLKSGKLKVSTKEVRCSECAGDGTGWPRPEPQLVREKGKLKEYTPTAIGKSAANILKDADPASGNGKEVDLVKRWENLDPEARAVVEAKLGTMPEATLDDVPPDVAVHYSARDADITLRVYHSLAPKIKAMGLERVLEMDMGVVPMIDRMQSVGWLIRPEHFHSLTTEFEGEMKRVERDIKRMVGVYVNPSSPKQVAELLFDRLKLPVIKMNKSRTDEATDDKVLESLRMKAPHPVIDLLLHYRELHKLVGTYTRPMPLKADEHTRVHTNLRITRTASGRLASFDPNLQNIPARPKHGRDNGKRIRAGFVASPGMLLGSWDLDQIEMRVLAHASRDPNLVKLFRGGIDCPTALAKGKCKCHDIHLLTASLIYRIPIEDVTDDQRTMAKSIGFGIVYGITSKGLKAQMEMRGQNRTEDECQDMIDAYLNVAYPGVRDYMEDAAAEARRFGYVRDMFGRIRYLPAVHSTVSWVAEEAIRQAGNHPIQAGAQGIIKIAMRNVWERVLPLLWKRGYKIECLMQIHDELIFEFEDGLEDLVDPLIRRAFAEAVELLVPIGSKGHTSTDWSGLK